MHEGSTVISKDDPLASGRMIVLEDKGGGWLVCESIHVKDPAGGYRRETVHVDELRIDQPARETA